MAQGKTRGVALPTPYKIRKGGREYVYHCSSPECVGRPARLEVNTLTGLWHCLRCKASGRIEVGGTPPLPLLTPPESQRNVVPVPPSLYNHLRSRGVDPSYHIPLYGLVWDGWRVCFPVSYGYWRRAVYPNQTPKVLFDPYPPDSKPVLGEHLLLGKTRMTIVVTEGDYKALSIPHPYVGIGIGGSELTSNQVDLLVYCKPRVVVLALDGGVDIRGVKGGLEGRGVPVAVMDLPAGAGPDDIPMSERVARLEAALLKEGIYDR